MQLRLSTQKSVICSKYQSKGIYWSSLPYLRDHLNIQESYHTFEARGYLRDFGCTSVSSTNGCEYGFQGREICLEKGKQFSGSLAEWRVCTGTTLHFYGYNNFLS